MLAWQYTLNSVIASGFSKIRVVIYFLILKILVILRALARSIQKADSANSKTLQSNVNLQIHLDTSVCVKPQYDKMLFLDTSVASLP